MNIKIQTCLDHIFSKKFWEKKSMWTEKFFVVIAERAHLSFILAI